MTKPFETIWLTLVRPKEGDSGVVAPVHFRTEDEFVCLVDNKGVQRVDAKGKPLKRQLGPGESARKIASIMGREYLPKPRSSFTRKLVYPPLNY